MSVIGDLFATLEARLDLLDAMRQELLDYLDRRQQGRVAAPAGRAAAPAWLRRHGRATGMSDRLRWFTDWITNHPP